MLGPRTPARPRLPDARAPVAVADADRGERNRRRRNKEPQTQTQIQNPQSLRPATPGTPSDAAALAAVRPPNPEDARRSFEEWMKIAADNNINPANTWNLALIDYFHDMSLLRDDGNSINFQKASCTLDGCVKIYTSRIDSVDTETKRLIDSLSEQRRGGKSGDDDNDDGDDGDARNRDVSKRVKQERRGAKHAGTGKTLEDDETELNWKHFDTEAAVDPLFKKTAAEFDEGGAHGLLLSHLMIGRNGKVLLDASDARTSGTTTTAIDSCTTTGVATSTPTPIPIDTIALSEMHVLETLFGDRLATISDMDICPTFASFRFDGTDEHSLDTLARMAENEVHATYHTGSTPPGASQSSAQLMDMNTSGGRGGGGTGDADPFGDNDTYDPFAYAAEMVDDDGDDDVGDFGIGHDDMGYGDDNGGGVSDTTNDQHNLAQLARELMIPGESGATSTGVGGVGNISSVQDNDVDDDEDDMGEGPDIAPMFSHFDLDHKRHWAGPEYWRSRSLRDAKKAKPVQGTASDTTTTVKKPKNIAPALDFVSGVVVDRDVILARPVSGPSSTLLPKSAMRAAATLSSVLNPSVFLPEDLHVTSECFTKYFLKPLVRVSLRRRLMRHGNGGQGETGMPTGISNNDDNGAFAEIVGVYGNDDDDDDDVNDNGGHISVGGGSVHGGNTPAIGNNSDDAVAEDYDTNFDFAYGDDVDVGPSPSIGFTSDPPTQSSSTNPTNMSSSQLSGSSLTQPQPYGSVSDHHHQQPLSFARTAKRVDVRRLKENIWRAIDIDIKNPSTSSLTESESESVPATSVDTETTTSMKQTTLTSVVSHLTSMYPTQSLQDISPAFCFICVLHLANEHGLDISSSSASGGVTTGVTGVTDGRGGGDAFGLGGGIAYGLGDLIIGMS